MNAVNIAEHLHSLGLQAREASARMAAASTAQKNAALRALAGLLRASVRPLQDENAADIARAKQAGLAAPMVDRLKLTPGIINTLALAVHERTRELGLLRAVGMSRWQVRWMVAGESVITALIGAVLGLVLGVVFAVIVSRPLEADGFVLTFPIVTLIAVTVLAAIAGVLAAIPPARRASRVDVLRAVTTE